MSKGGALSFTPPDSPSWLLLISRLSFQSDSPTNFPFNSSFTLIFKDFKANFLKRPEGDVHFICNDGLAIRDLVKQASGSGVRHNYKLNIDATVPSLSKDVVARFELTLSLKDKT